MHRSKCRFLSGLRSKWPCNIHGILIFAALSIGAAILLTLTVIRPDTPSIDTGLTSGVVREVAHGYSPTAAADLLYRAKRSFFSNFLSKKPPFSDDEMTPVFKPIVPFSFVSACSPSHATYLPRLLKNTLQATVIPAEIIFVLGIKEETNIFPQDEFQELVRNSPVKVNLLLRHGSLLAGAARVFAASHATQEIVYFFDCDDVQHPQRMETLWRLWMKEPELDAVLTGLKGVVEAEYFTHPWTPFTKEEMEGCAKLSAEELNNTFSTQEELGLPKWDVNNPRSEVLWPGQPFWFPLKDLKGKTKVQEANGWLTVKRSVLKEIPYPQTLAIGEDSLFTFRLIRARKNWRICELQLGGYVSQKKRIDKNFITPDF